MVFYEWSRKSTIDTLPIFFHSKRFEENEAIWIRTFVVAFGSRQKRIHSYSARPYTQNDRQSDAVSVQAVVAYGACEFVLNSKKSLCMTNTRTTHTYIEFKKLIEHIEYCPTHTFCHIRTNKKYTERPTETYTQRIGYNNMWTTTNRNKIYTHLEHFSKRYTQTPQSNPRPK